MKRQRAALCGAGSMQRHCGSTQRWPSEPHAPRSESRALFLRKYSAEITAANFARIWSGISQSFLRRIPGCFQLFHQDRKRQKTPGKQASL